MSLTVIVNGNTYALSREMLLKIGSESILAEALRTEPDLSGLELTHASLTPEVMAWLVQLLATGQIPKPIPSYLAEAGHYIGMPLLEYVGQKDYTSVPNLADVESLNKLEVYTKLLITASKEANEPLTRYLLSCVLPEKYVDIECIALMYSILKGNLRQVKRFLQREVQSKLRAGHAGHGIAYLCQELDPELAKRLNLSTHWDQDVPMIAAARYGFMNILKELLTYADPPLCYEVHAAAIQGHHNNLALWLLAHHTDDANYYEAEVFQGYFHLAIEADLPDVVAWLLQEPRLGDISDKDYLGRAVYLPNPDILKMLLASPLLQLEEYVLGNACMRGHLNNIKLVFSDPRALDLQVHSKYLARLAEAGQLEAVTFLLTLPGIDPTLEDNRTFREVCRHGDAKLAQHLLTFPGVRPEAKGSTALWQAVRHNHLNDADTSDVIELLLADERMDPKFALLAAVKRESLSLVQRLLRDPRVDPTFNNGAPLQIAENYYMEDIADFLRTDPRVIAYEKEHGRIKRYV